MINAVASFFQVLLGVSGTVAVSPASSAALVAILLAAAVVVVLLHVAGAPRSVGGSLAHPARAIDVSVAVAQSDPDAPGHARSRAPGVAASAA